METTPFQVARGFLFYRGMQDIANFGSSDVIRMVRLENTNQSFTALDTGRYQLTAWQLSGHTLTFSALDLDRSITVLGEIDALRLRQGRPASEYLRIRDLASALGAAAQVRDIESLRPVQPVADTGMDPRVSILTRSDNPYTVGLDFTKYMDHGSVENGLQLQDRAGRTVPVFPVWIYQALHLVPDRTGLADAEGQPLDLREDYILTLSDDVEDAWRWLLAGDREFDLRERWGARQFTVRAQAGANGSIAPPVVLVTEGDQAELTVTPAAQHRILDVSGCDGTLQDTSYTTGAIEQDCVVTASFALNRYQVTISAGQGGSANAATQWVDHGLILDFALSPETGYSIGTVSGCSGTLDGNRYTTDRITSACEIDIRFTPNRYQVQFDSQGGSALEGADLDFGSSWNLPTAGPTRTGYRFLGWNTAADGSGTPYTAGGSLTISAADVTLYAQWQINQYTLTFETGGGSEVDAITQDFGTAVTEPANPTRTGYTFTGWNSAIPETIPAENLTFTAQWQINQYTLTFDSAGGSTVAAITQDFGTAVTAPANPTRTGYTFARWSPAVPTTIPAEDQTFTAQWEVNRYTLRFVSENVLLRTTNLAPGATITAPNKPARVGYSFTGWSPALPTKMPAQDQTFTAIWQIIENLIEDRYEVLGIDGGIIHDTGSGLEWMRCSIGQAWNSTTQRCTGNAVGDTFEGAQAAASRMNNSGGYGGYTDWRVPSIEELRTIVYCSSGEPGYFSRIGCSGNYSHPTIVEVAFPDTPSSIFWSNSRSGCVAGVGWGMSFRWGNTSCRITGTAHVRLVRGGQ